MKHPVYWFLISSGLIASTSMSLATPVEITLPSSDSYNGNNSPNATFTPKETANATGTKYICTGDVCIANISTPQNKSCFSDSQGDLIFQGNNHSLCFENINTTTKPAAIEVTTSAGKNLSVTGFSMFSCSFCPPGTTGQGAIKSTGTTTFDNDSKILFQQNCSTENGGAITCKGLTLQNSSNSTLFSGNTSQKHGGAIHSESTTNIINNNNIDFSNNKTIGSSDSSGGAIYCSETSNNPELKFEGNGQLTFLGNSSQVSGGAIYAKKLILTSGGPTIFANNSVTATADPKGGAICLDTSGECSLTADRGNIIFDGNTVTTSGNSGSSKRNSIDLNTSGKFTRLNARDGFGIFFYDPIANNGDTATTLNINQTADSISYTGKIVFSGEKLSQEETGKPENLSSYFKQPVTLSSGSFILKEGVTVEAKSFTQTTGSSVIMDIGTTLQTPDNGGDIINLTNLSINVTSFGGGVGSSSTAKVHSQTTSKAVTVTAISFVDNDGNGYEYPVFSKTRDFVSAVTIQAATGTTPTIPVASNSPDLPPSHYGYQGYWTTAWNNGTDTKSANLTWTQTGYLPNPERQGPLVPNTLWGSFSDVRAIQNLMDVSVNGADYQRGFWVSGLANFLHKSGTATKRKFRHNSAGYVLGAFVKTPSEDIFSAAFCQLFGKDKDYLVSKNSSNIYAGSIYYQHTSFWSAWDRLLQNTIGAQAPLVLNAQLTYSHTSNDMKTNMTQRYAPPKTTYSEIKGDWGNDCFGVELGATVPIESQYSSLFDMYSPFLRFQLVHAHQEDFKENSSTEGRYFESSNLTNLSMPIGVKFERFSDNDNASYNLTLAYAPDLARSNPDCTTSLLISPTTAVWLTKATNLARQAFIVRAGNYLSLSSNFEIFSQFGFELRGSSRTYNVDLGSKIQF
ncbi:autotransporter domain-containing protein [Chlamydia crocodili]|uniref:autotransporter domain-containing protein n=1 Tax=Chlamydia crocodili TaxID=2766982 RepID=UPI003D3D1B83